MHMCTWFHRNWTGMQWSGRVFLVMFSNTLLFVLHSDVDECILGLCGNNSECFNTVGNFSCICSTGYVLDGMNNCTSPGKKIPLLLGIIIYHTFFRLLLSRSL